MHQQRRSGSMGFTLMELLVVIAIIGILAAIIFPAINAALKRAQISKAKAEMAGIASAIKAYYETYGVMPVPGDANGNPDWTYGRRNGSDRRPQNIVMNILRGIDSTNNPRRIVFLEVPIDSLKSDGDKANQSYTQSDGYYIDPWGNPYIISLDTDFDGEIGGIQIDTPARTYLHDVLSPQGDSTFQGVTVGVMSYGPEPDNPEKSFLTSW